MRVELREVGKRFESVIALSRVTLEVPSGARVALIGPNGSGKTTLTRAIMGAVAHEGEVRLGGLPAGARGPELARRLAYVPQVAPQLAASVGELIGCVARLRGLPVERFEALVRRFELDPAQLRARPFRGLSGGMKQKLLLALALAAAPALLVLDEPTASLDAAARTRFYELYEQHAGQATLLLCSHRLDEIRHLVDHVLALEDGQVTYYGPAEAYLLARTVAVLELQLEPGSTVAAAWARARGFTPGMCGWWTRPVSGAEKLLLVSQALAELGSQLRNLSVRDLDRVAPEVDRAA